MTLNRRELLGYGASSRLGRGGDWAAAIASPSNDLTIALQRQPAILTRPRPLGREPTIQGLYQSVFDQFIPQSPTFLSRLACSRWGGATPTRKS